MKFIQRDDVLAVLSFTKAIEVMKQCFADYQKGLISQEQRQVSILPDDKNKNIFAMMPAYLGADRVFGAKLITAFPDNHQLDMPSHLGEILLFDSQNGQPVAMVDANVITWMRTAAVSALATDYLAKKTATTLALLGAGQQAASHLHAISCIRTIQTVFVYDIYEQNTDSLIEKLTKEFPEIRFVKRASIQEAVAEAEIICTLTPSKEAILQKEWVQQGAHINAIGTFTPTTRELSSELMTAGTIYVDDYEAALKESGDVLIPISEGLITDTDIIGSLGELVTNTVSGRSNAEEITIFDAVGLAVEDVCCAEFIFNSLQKEGK